MKKFMVRNRRKIIYYLPGLISMVGLPLLLFIYGMPQLHNYRVLRLNIPSSQHDDGGEIIRFSEDYVYREVKNKNIETIDFQPGLWNEKLQSYAPAYVTIDHSLTHFYNAHDTGTVMRIRLTDSNSYGDFVWLCNQMILHNFKRYALVQNDFYIFSNAPPAIDQNVLPPPIYL